MLCKYVVDDWCRPFPLYSFQSFCRYRIWVHSLISLLSIIQGDRKIYARVVKPSLYFSVIQWQRSVWGYHCLLLIANCTFPNSYTYTYSYFLGTNFNQCIEGTIYQYHKQSKFSFLNQMEFRIIIPWVIALSLQLYNTIKES